MYLDTTLNIKILLSAYFRYRCDLPNELIDLIFYKFQSFKHAIDLQLDVSSDFELDNNL